MSTINEIDVKLSIIRKFSVQWVNGYHWTELDLKDFYEAMEYLNKFERLVSGKDTTL